MSKPLSKTLEALIAAMFDTKAETVLAAVEKVPLHGRAEVIIPLIRAYQSWKEEPLIQEKITKILHELKSETVIPELIKALESKEFVNERAFIVSAFWNSGLYPHDHLETLVKAAIEGDFLVAFEVLTVIEHMEEIDHPDAVQDAMLDIQDYLDENPEASNSEVLVQIKDVLENSHL